RALLASSPAGKPRHTLLLGGPGAGADSAAPPTTPRPATSAARDLPPEPATPLPPALTALGLSVAFAVPGGTRPVLDDVSFTLPAGRTLGLVGPSGSGKTTIARIALGLQKADAGELRLFGEPWSSLPERERRPRRGIIGAVYQDPLASFDPRLTVGQILGDAVGVDRRPDRGTARNHTAGSIAGLLDSVGLAADTVVRRPRTLSGGQRQRVAIARALGAGPRVLVLDEPVSSLDVSVQAQILDLLDSLQRELGLSYLFISHDTDVTVHMSDEVLDLAALAQTPTQTPTQRAIG
ncbi:MAG: ABC transporter ATP-binding protein, partial [Burkholderiaceae bacterium]|nr:ABC transporter ATP-binding protein [Microbacteriaceae bacterium]